MGCTSSTPNTLSASASKEDKSIQFEEEAEETYSKQVAAIHTEREHRTELKVLPPSDTKEPVQLVRNNKSTNSLETQKDLNTNGHIVESDSNDTSGTTNESYKDEEKEDTFSKLILEEVVGKFIEITHQDTNHDKDPDPNANETESTEKDKEQTEARTETEFKENDDEYDNKSKEAEDASPCQSQSSRATRWEALADIAAELPPSLAVDPITGQIYSLSK